MFRGSSIPTHTDPPPQYTGLLAAAAFMGPASTVAVEIVVVHAVVVEVIAAAAGGRRVKGAIREVLWIPFFRLGRDLRDSEWSFRSLIGSCPLVIPEDSTDWRQPRGLD